MNSKNIVASLLCTAAIAATGLTLSTSTALGQPAEKTTKSPIKGDRMDQCIKMSSACVIACGKASTHCTKFAKDNKGEHAAMASLSADCSDCCASFLAFASRNSQLSTAMAACCATCCDQCATECEKMPGDEMKECAKACRECATACRAMAR